MNAIPNVIHEIELFREENGKLTPVRIKFDSRRVILSETQGTPKLVTKQISSPAAQTEYFDKHGYGYEKTDTGVVINYVPPTEIMLAYLVDLSQPMPDGFPKEAGEVIRKSYAESLEALKTANPDCSDCEISKLKRRYMDMGRAILKNHGSIQSTGPGN